jgi:hypothetical protein
MPPPKNQKELIDSLIETASRNDERIKSILEEQESFVTTHDKFRDDLKEISKECHDIKIKLESLTIKVDKSNNFWEKVFDNFWKLALMVIGGAILYFLNLQSPPSD